MCRENEPANAVHVIFHFSSTPRVAPSLQRCELEKLCIRITSKSIEQLDPSSYNHASAWFSLLVFHGIANFAMPHG
jgi:hypothetical protein